MKHHQKQYVSTSSIRVSRLHPTEPTASVGFTLHLIKCQTQIVTGIDYKRSCELKKNATMYFDQFVVGFYGNSALEAMQWGIPVVNWISEMAIGQAKGKLANCPVINRSQTSPERTADKVIQMMDDVTLSERTKKWCDSVHGYKAIAKQWVKLYKSIL